MDNQTTTIMNTTTTATATKKAQNVIAVSESAKKFVASMTLAFIAPSKSKPDGMQATEREVFDGMVDFVEAYRYSTQPTMAEVMEETDEIDEETGEFILKGTGEFYHVHDDDGQPLFHKVDEFALVMSDVLAIRMTTARTNSASAVIASKDAELAALRAQLATLQGEA